MATIICRALTSANCLHGQSFNPCGEELELHEDGTFDGTSIVCDSCYVDIMPLTPSRMGLIHELPAAIAKAKARAKA